MSNVTAVLDACVLYPASLRDLLMHLTLGDLFKAKWTNQIHNEWMRNLLKNRKDLTRSQLKRTRDLMNYHVLDCLVTNYSSLIPLIDLKDKDDRHVVAAAIKSGSSMIVTYNISDFQIEVIGPYGIVPVHPDDFLSGLFAQLPTEVLHCVAKQRKSLKIPPLSALDLIEVFEKINLTRFAQQLRHKTEHI
jgi:predicted nucleic acid-binding protein